MQVDRVKPEGFQLTSCEKKKLNQVSRLSPALGNVFRVPSTTKKKTKKSTKQGPISPLFADADLLCGDTLENTTSDFSSENTDWKRSWMLSDHLTYFQPSSKATTEEEAVTPENGIGYRVFSCYRTRCEIIILSHRCWKKTKQNKKWYEAVSTRLFFFFLKKMKCTILKWHFMYRIYTLLAHGHTKLDLFTFRGFKW